MKPELTILGFETSNNIKVRVALGFKEIPYEFRTIDPADRSEIVRLSGQHLTPVLVHGDRVLFDSAAKITTRTLVGVLLTGMGGDGAKGLLHLRQAGALTIGQDRRSCVVYGMPKVAFELGAVQIQCAPGNVPRTIIQTLAADSTHRIPAATT